MLFRVSVYYFFILFIQSPVISTCVITNKAVRNIQVQVLVWEYFHPLD